MEDCAQQAKARLGMDMFVKHGRQGVSKVAGLQDRSKSKHNNMAEEIAPEDAKSVIKTKTKHGSELPLACFLLCCLKGVQ